MFWDKRLIDNFKMINSNNLNHSKPFILTNRNCLRKVEKKVVYDIERDENGVPVRNENGSFNITEGTITDVVVFEYENPYEFKSSNNRPKRVVIDNLVLYNSVGELLLGFSVHMSFQSEIDLLDCCVGFVTPEFKEKTWKVPVNEEDVFRVWFRNPRWEYFEPFLFVITGFYQY